MNVLTGCMVLYIHVRTSMLHFKYMYIHLLASTTHLADHEIWEGGKLKQMYIIIVSTNWGGGEVVSTLSEFTCSSVRG